MANSPNPFNSSLDWDFQTQHVDPSALNRDGSPSGPRGNYISSESILLAAGPATLADATRANLTVAPIGVCDAIQVVQNKGVVQLYEIGSRLPYILPGRPIIQIQISRVLFNGDSLLGALSKQNGQTPDDFVADVIGMPGVTLSNVNGGDTSGAFYMNLASHFFNQPSGLAIFFKDSDNQWVAGYYAENCIIQSHSMAIQGQNMVVMENASIRCTGLPPIPSPAA
jgi:hypothetical protein